MATVTGTTGNDTLAGTLDPLTGLAADDSVDGQDGIDVFVLTGAIGSYRFGFDPGSGMVTVTGPEGTDRLQGIELIQAADGVNRSLAALIELTEPVFTITPTATTIGNDHLLGTDVAEYLNAGFGDDSIAAGGGNDWVFGGPGNDIALGQAGDDHLEGYAGNDALFGGAGDDGINGDLIGQTGNDYLSGGGGNDWINAGNGADILVGGDGNDWLFGEYGPDLLSGGSGNDVLIGDFYASRYVKPVVYPKDPPNDDALSGGAGGDFLMGGMGADLLEGGSGRDWFVFTDPSESSLAAPDIILDFGGAAVAAASAKGNASFATPGSEYDAIDLSEIDAVSSTTENDAFTFIGTAAFTAAGQLRYASTGTETYIEGNVGGDLASDFRIVVKLANYSFSLPDFVL
ncbi:calcium-binding protein [Azospirillum agricola]|uniref:calcium-binding protein n=1 Tax=Azospirillum agricola TaxID=1720247 RepID=UPI000A0F0CC9|nr:calcium-binding protein [Azospirillum agricola]SMH41351.1 Hemolysin-type calcium-binding repeat-containing protein [Azospirillum lipoferum]